MMELYSLVETPCEIILVDDCSTDENIAGAMGFWTNQSKHSVIPIKTPKNLGFGGAMNHGAKRATEDVYVFLSNDVQLLYDFVPDVLEKISENKKCLVGNELYNYDTGWNVLRIHGKPMMFMYLAGYFLACTKKVWKDLGGFDDIFMPFDYEDVDLSTTAIMKGYKLVPLNSKRLLHASGQTVRRVRPDRESITYRNQQRFIGKWSKILKDE
jgi:GT2 family glycosyltransferase